MKVHEESGQHSEKNISFYNFIFLESIDQNKNKPLRDLRIRLKASVPPDIIDVAQQLKKLPRIFMYKGLIYFYHHAFMRNNTFVIQI